MHATNRLAGESSPYLQQHAENPVEWYPWGSEALEKARREDKPILLSIGYSACHWCHVMAHESFEDPAIARVMNERFVNVKVDREERPDLDKIYQLAHHLLTQRSGGWPLTMFLTPDDRVPFFGGTYFPPKPRHGLPGFPELLGKVAAFYAANRDQIRRQNQAVLDALQSLSAATPADTAGLDAAVLESAREQIGRTFDARHGGFGQAPKFPHPTTIERLLRHWSEHAVNGGPDGEALEMAVHTLRRMALGGLYDQLGGGFARYSVDERWMIPHFEKMLYDNGPLLALYADAWQITGEALFRRVAEETAGWVMREMQAPRGGYYSTLDADSDGEEGKFYVWTPQQVRALLTEEEYAVTAPHYGLERPANFEGHWHLNVHAAATEIAQQRGLSPEQVHELLSRARAKLFAAREQRVRPGRDEKILTAWNGLMIKGMAVAGRRLQRADLVASAEAALDFVRAELWRDGRLLATHKDGRSHLPAYLDDHVFLIDGILELLQARWRGVDLEFAVQLAELVLAHFADPQGGFFFTADDHEPLIQRPKPFADEALPSGNGIAAYVLGRLGHLLGEARYLRAAERALEAAAGSIQQAPFAHDALLLALEEQLFPPQTVVLRGRTPSLTAWQERCTRPYAPRRIAVAIPSESTDLSDALARYRATDEVVAYVCTGTHCSAPISSLERLKAELRSLEPHASPS
jgi:uncharacterized protein